MPTANSVIKAALPEIQYMFVHLKGTCTGKQDTDKQSQGKQASRSMKRPISMNQDNTAADETAESQQVEHMKVAREGLEAKHAPPRSLRVLP